MTDVMETRKYTLGKATFICKWILDVDPDFSYMGKWSSAPGDYYVDRVEGILYGPPINEQRTFKGRWDDYTIGSAGYWKAKAEWKAKNDAFLGEYDAWFRMEYNGKPLEDMDDEEFEAWDEQVWKPAHDGKSWNLCGPHRDFRGYFEYEGDSDTEWLEEHSEEITDWIMVDDETIRVTIFHPEVLATGLPAKCYDPSRYMRYWIPSDNYPPNTDDPETNEEYIKYILEDHKRMEGYEANDWFFWGCVATMYLEGEEIESAGVWGIESDCGEEYMKEVEQEQMALCMANAREKQNTYINIAEQLSLLDEDSKPQEAEEG